MNFLNAAIYGRLRMWICSSSNKAKRTLTNCLAWTGRVEITLVADSRRGVGGGLVVHKDGKIVYLWKIKIDEVSANEQSFVPRLCRLNSGAFPICHAFPSRSFFCYSMLRYIASCGEIPFGS
eukprot:scaffold101_cov123-Cylindrotheca_fusiformis.AAC.16